MPELPEVEIARRNLLRWLDGHRVVGATAEKGRELGARCERGNPPAWSYSERISEQESGGG